MGNCIQVKEYNFGDIIVCLCIQEDGQAGFSLYPAVKRDMTGIIERQRYHQDNCVQVRVEGDDYPNGFSNGHTYRNGQTSKELVYQEDYMEETESGQELHVVLASSAIRAEHIVQYRCGENFLQVSTAVTNTTDRDLALEMLSSFSIGGIFPSERYEDIGSVKVCRLRSKWSNEGRLEKIPLEDLQLEPSWSGYGAASERFGQTGSLPVRRFFPIAGVEDEAAGVAWGAKLSVPSSWQMEFYRREQELCFSGGLADLDFGHWKKLLRPGERFESPKAYLTVCTGGFEEVCRRLVSSEKKPDRWKETQLPVIFNEFCTTWGMPSEKNIKDILAKIKGKGMDYFVIDAGWYADEVKGWEMSMGDWKINPSLFPGGFKKCTEMIRDAGMRPGIWFEIETVGQDAQAFENTDLLLKRNGHVITVGCRRFWDMRNPEAIAYLAEHVIDFLRKYSFSYLKIDYNDSIGVGCDGAESPGEGLRQAVLASREFIRRIREELPDLVIENCSSGGHRLETSMMSICDFLSFSDAHEVKEIPVIAANLHRVLQPSKSEIWAVLRKTDDARRLYYSMCNTFLGVQCLSGDIHELSPEQWNIVEDGIAFYKRVSGVIRDGETYLKQENGKSYRHLTGWQSVMRVGDEGAQILVVSHNFCEPAADIVWKLPGEYEVAEVFGEEMNWSVSGNILSGMLIGEFAASAVLLERKDGSLVQD
ncbi:alpha-galactosidase [Blautia schinkii]|nr:alpha-galactosidase [Blautia schinkii]